MHLETDKLSALAEQALGLDPDLDAGGAEAGAALGREDFLHLAACEFCQEGLARLSAMLSGAESWEPEALDDYRAVSFEAFDVPEDLRVVPEAREAADDNGLAQIGPCGEVGQCYRSADDCVELLVAEDYADDCCRLTLVNLAVLDTSQVRLYLPPGLILPWPPTDEFEFPRYTYRDVDWSQVKLLYPQRPSG